MGEIVTPSFSSTSNFLAKTVASAPSGGRKPEPPLKTVPAIPSVRVPKLELASLTVDTEAANRENFGGGEDYPAGNTWTDQTGHRVTVVVESLRRGGDSGGGDDDAGGVRHGISAG